MSDCLTATSLKKQYRHFSALNGLSMHVPNGAVYGLVGKNGAGKTTLIRLICGLQEPTEGSYQIYGVSNSNPAIARVRKRMGAVVETPSIYLGMTAEQNLRQQYLVLGKPSFEGIGELLRLVGLGHTGRKRTGNFSLGMKQRLGIAIALCGDPDLLILDEPVNGLDPQGIVEIRELLLRLNQEKHITILISSHILDELSRLATHYGFIDSGCMVKEISAGELAAACRRCIRLSVTGIRPLCRVLDTMGLEYTVASDSEADIFGEVNITDLALSLAREGCEILSVHEREESLENYYINLVGGSHHA